MVDRQYVNEFITRTFNYLNGRVNIFNYPAKLEIDWIANRGSGVGAHSGNPNLITIYPSVVRRLFNDDYLFYYNLVICLIHELLHTDQVIDYIEMTRNPSYLADIENCVEYESYLFMANNQIALEQAIGFRDRFLYSGYPKAIQIYETGHTFRRRDYRTHIVSILQDMTREHTSSLINNINHIFMDPNSMLTMIINDKILDIKIGLECCPLVVLNNLLYEEFFKYNYRAASVKFKNIIEDNSAIRCILMIQTDGKNILCHINN